MDHYYSRNPSSDSHRSQIDIHVRGVSLTLTVDTGVFSKRGLDYGTRVLLETVRLTEHALVVDLGCGYGPVTAVLARVYPNTHWIAVDVNPRAVELTRVNVGALTDRVTVVQSDGFEDVEQTSVDAVLLNPPIRAGKSVVYGLFAAAKARLAPSGALWVVIHKKHGAVSAEAKLTELFDSVALMERDGGYRVFRCDSMERVSSADTPG